MRFPGAQRLEAKQLSRKLGLQLLLALLFLVSPQVIAQSSDQNPSQEKTSMIAPVSDLARQNMQRVAATAAQIKAVLIKDTGLMVELKRWIARDATNHGQLISDSELTEPAIYIRLENDIEFRSVATVLLQKFGYLLPQVNPDSPEGKEQELLIEERSKWQAQDEEEQLKSARQVERPASAEPQKATEQPKQFGAPVSLRTGSPSGNPSVSPVLPQNPIQGLEKAQMLQQQRPQILAPSGVQEAAYSPALFATTKSLETVAQGGTAGLGSISGTPGVLSNDSATYDEQLTFATEGAPDIRSRPKAECPRSRSVYLGHEVLGWAAAISPRRLVLSRD